MFETFSDFAQAVTDTGMSTRAVARAIGIKSSELRAYMRGQRNFDYPVQFAIESLQPPFVVESQIGADYENVWAVGGEPETFPSRVAAFAAIGEHLESLEESGMDSVPMRIVPL